MQEATAGAPVGTAQAPSCASDLLHFSPRNRESPPAG